MRTEYTNEKLQWINCAKFVAIFAVILDHTYKILYTDSKIRVLSYFSVVAFVFLSGITSFYSNQRHINEPVLKDIVRRVKGILLPYALATLIYQIVTTRFWDMREYITYLFNFNISAPFYFIVFYVQLLIFSPLIYRFTVCKIRGGGMEML